MGGNSDHGLSFLFSSRELVLLNPGGSNSPWSEFWSEFPHFMGMGVVPAPSSFFFPSGKWSGSAQCFCQAWLSRWTGKQALQKSQLPRHPPSLHLAHSGEGCPETSRSASGTKETNQTQFCGAPALPCPSVPWFFFLNSLVNFKQGMSLLQKRPFVHNSVCSQFLEALFAILAECSQFCLRSF